MKPTIWGIALYEILRIRYKEQCGKRDKGYEVLETAIDMRLARGNAEYGIYTMMGMGYGL